jgi:hypothetical protein
MSELDYEFHNPEKIKLADICVTEADQRTWLYDEAWYFCEFDSHIFLAQTVG